MAVGAREGFIKFNAPITTENMQLFIEQVPFNKLKN